LRSFTRDGQDVPVSQSFEHGYRRLSFVADLQRGDTATWVLRYGVPIGGDGYHLRLYPQPLAKPARLQLSVLGALGNPIHAAGAGVPVHNGQVDIDEPWLTTKTVSVTLHHRSLWEKLKDVLQF
jgi:hypothetical protein